MLSRLVFNIQRCVIGIGIGVYAVNPGIVRNTNHLKSSPFAKSLMARISTYPWIWLFLKTPKQGCQTVVFTAVEPNLSTVTGVYLRYILKNISMCIHNMLVCAIIFP